MYCYNENSNNHEGSKGDKNMTSTNKETKNLSSEQRKELIKKASKAVNKQYGEAFKMISKN